MPVLLALLVLLPEASACTGGGDLEVVHPRYGVLHPDDALWLRLDAPGLELQVLEGGVEVAVERHTLGLYDLLFRDGGWDPAMDYVVVYGGSPHTIREVSAGATAVASPPTAVRRTVWTEAWYEIHEDNGCYGEPTGAWASWSGVTFTTCSHDLLLVSALGDVEPPAPALDDGVDWSIGPDYAAFDSDGDWPDAGPGASTTVWLGTLDATGGFSGWVAEPVTLPGPRERREDRKESVAASSTPTAWDACPTGDWVLGEVEPLSGPPWVGDGEGEEGCGCTTSPSGGLAWLLGLAAFTRRRRHA